MLKGKYLGATLGLALLSTSAFAIRNGVSGRYFNQKSTTVEFEINRGRDIEGVCSGVRIHQNYALTVAHCFTGVSENRTFKLTYYNSLGRRITINRKVSDNIVLDTELEKELVLVPLGNPTDEYVAPTIFKGAYDPSPIRFFGYGMQRSGRFGGLQTATLTWSHILQNTYGKMIVTSPGVGDAHPCPGDSGGPLFKEVDGEQHLAGVISFVRRTDGELGTDRKKVCQRANRAFFIPLQDHLDFLSTYFEVKTTPQPEPIIRVVVAPSADLLLPIAVTIPYVEKEDTDLVPTIIQEIEPEEPQPLTENQEEVEATNLAENETSPSAEPVLTEE